MNFYLRITLLFTLMISAANLPAKEQKPCSDWVAQIDNEYICKKDVLAEHNAVLKIYAAMQGYSLNQFKKLLRKDAFIKQNPMLLQLREKYFITRYINEYLVYKEALKKNIHKRKDVQSIIKYQTKSVVTQRYLDLNSPDIKVSEQEARQFYEANVDNFPSLRNISKKDAVRKVKKYLIDTKKKEVLQKLIEEARNLYIIKLRSGY